jgi:hypothetical protein
MARQRQCQQEIVCCTPIVSHAQDSGCKPRGSSENTLIFDDTKICPVDWRDKKARGGKSGRFHQTDFNRGIQNTQDSTQICGVHFGSKNRMSTSGRRGALRRHACNARMHGCVQSLTAWHLCHSQDPPEAGPAHTITAFVRQKNSYLHLRLAFSYAQGAHSFTSSS